MDESLIDARTGIIRQVRRVPVPDHLPACFDLVAAELSDVRGLGAPQGDSAGAGYAIGDPAAARAAAIGEAIERYCGNLVPPRLPRGSYRGLYAAGERPIDPATVALFSEEQYATPGFPFRPLTHDLPLEWARGTDLLHGGAALLPAPLVWVSYPLTAARAGRGTNPIIQAGIAAGRGRADAEYRALCEVIERDAVALGWHAHGDLRAIRPPSWLGRIGKGGAHNLRTRFFEFPSSLLCVLGALVYDEHTGHLTMGTASRPDPVEALRKAFAEACQLQLFVAGYDDPDGPYMRAARDPASPLKPWRPDRDYRNAYRADLADAVDYGCHLQLFLDPEIQSRFRAELDHAVDRSLDHSELTRYDEGRDALLDRIALAGFDVFSAELTTADVVPSGLSVVRVLVPGMYSNSAAGLPFLGGRRLADRLAVRGESRRVLPLPH